MKKHFLILLFCLILNIYGFGTNWKTPLGIPTPDFGIEQKCQDYKDKQYDYDGDGTSESPYKGSGDSIYTHYIDNTSQLASDDNNPYGSKEKPRKTFPAENDIHPGAVILVYAGIYTNNLFITSNGTDEKPIYVRGLSNGIRPKLKDVGSFMIRACYIIFENFELVNTNVDIRNWYTTENVHHVSVRHCEIHNWKGTSNNSMISITGAEDPNYRVHDVVCYNNRIHPENYDTTSTNLPEIDIDGVGIGRQSNRIWIVDNEIYYCMGDAIGGGHNCNYTSTNIYIGRNILTNCAENAFDIKEVKNIVFSQNKCFNFKPRQMNMGGCAIVLHYGPNFAPINGWLIFNEIYDCSDVGIQIGGDMPYDVWIIGNVIHDIHNANNTGFALQSWGSRGIYFINNTVCKSDNGFNITGSGADSGRLLLYNNIIYLNGSGTQMIIDDLDGLYCNSTKVFNNIFYQPSGPIKINWAGTNFTLESFQSTTGKGVGCFSKEPLFTNTNSLDFSLQSGSPAINAGTETDVYKMFFDTFAIKIDCDYLGMQRPFGSKWDIGAFEYSSTININNRQKTDKEFLSLFSISINGISIIVKNSSSSTWRSTLSIIDFKGRKCGVINPLIYPGKNLFKVSEIVSKSSSLVEGCYYILLKNGKDVFNKKLLISKRDD